MLNVAFIMCIYLYIFGECFIFDTCVYLFRMNIFDISLDLEYLSFNFYSKYLYMMYWLKCVLSCCIYLECNGRGGVAQCIGRITRSVEVVGSSPIKGLQCYLEQDNLPLLLSTGLFHERIRVWFHNRTKIDWGPYGRMA